MGVGQAPVVLQQHLELRQILVQVHAKIVWMPPQVKNTALARCQRHPLLQATQTQWQQSTVPARPWIEKLTPRHIHKSTVRMWAHCPLAAQGQAGIGKAHRATGNATDHGVAMAVQRMLRIAAIHLNRRLRQDGQKSGDNLVAWQYRATQAGAHAGRH